VADAGGLRAEVAPADDPVAAAGLLDEGLGAAAAAGRDDVGRDEEAAGFAGLDALLLLMLVQFAGGSAETKIA
jgi:hypothetical protein